MFDLITLCVVFSITTVFGFVSWFAVVFSEPGHPVRLLIIMLMAASSTYVCLVILMLTIKIILYP